MSTDDLDDRSWAAYFGGRYLTAAAVGARLTLTVDHAEIEAVENPDTKEIRKKLVIHWRSDDRPWVPSKTAATCLAAMWGDALGRWKGRAVTIYNDPTVKVSKKGGGTEQVGGIRVRGAPDLTAPLELSVKVTTRRRPEAVTLIPTGDPLALALADLDASEAALAAALSALSKPQTIPTEPERRARLAQALRRGWEGVADVIRGTAVATDQTTTTTTEAGADAGRE
jgi:hypothetical protein